MMVYVNGQDIARLVVGTLKEGQWVRAPETLNVSPEEYLLGLESFLERADIRKSEIDGFVVVRGPGSATALRTSHALVNALAFALKAQVVSVNKPENAPDEQIVNSLSEYTPHSFALPEYSRGPNITASKRDSLRRKSE